MKYICLEDLMAFIDLINSDDDAIFWKNGINPFCLEDLVQDGINKKKVRVLYRNEKYDEFLNNVEDALRASRAMNAADDFELTLTERMFTAMYLTIYSSLKESFDKDLEKAKKDILKGEKNESELTLNSEVAVNNIRKKLKGE